MRKQSTLFGLPKVDAFRNYYDYLQQNSTTRMFEFALRICATHFMVDRFVNLGQYKAGWTKAISRAATTNG